MSVVVPTLNEEAMLPLFLNAIARLPGRFQLLVADGGSDDATRRIASAHPRVDAVIAAPRGRARQMNAGAAAASGDVLLFLHADTRLPDDAWESIAQAVADPAITGGNFALRFDGGGVFSRFLGAVYASHRRRGVFYGDSAIFLPTRVFERLGGFPDQPIMEDFEMARRIGREGPTACLAGPAVTSSRRWRRAGLIRTVASWILIRWLYEFGVPPQRLAPIYRAVR